MIARRRPGERRPGAVGAVLRDRGRPDEGSSVAEHGRGLARGGSVQTVAVTDVVRGRMEEMRGAHHRRRAGAAAHLGGADALGAQQPADPGGGRGPRPVRAARAPDDAGLGAAARPAETELSRTLQCGRRGLRARRRARVRVRRGDRPRPVGAAALARLSTRPRRPSAGRAEPTVAPTRPGKPGRCPSCARCGRCRRRGAEAPRPERPAGRPGRTSPRCSSGLTRSPSRLLKPRPAPRLSGGQRLDRHDLERPHVRRPEDDLRRQAGLVRLEPARAQRHQRSPGCRPSKPHSGRGVERSFPAARLKSRNSSVITAQTVWLPTSSGPVEQQPSR